MSHEVTMYVEVKIMADEMLAAGFRQWLSEHSIQPIAADSGHGWYVGTFEEQHERAINDFLDYEPEGVTR